MDNCFVIVSKVLLKSINQGVSVFLDKEVIHPFTDTSIKLLISHDAVDNKRRVSFKFLKQR